MRKKLAIFALLTVCATSAWAEGLTVASGAGYRRPMAQVFAAYEAQGGESIGQVYGNMGQVLGQARESGQIAMVCGDRKVLAKAEGLTFTRFVPLGAGKLVVAYAKGQSLRAAEDIAQASVTRIGIPDAKAAIYGKAGREYLAASGLGDQVGAKLISVQTVPQVTAYLTTGEVEAGFLNITDAIGAGAAIGGYVPVDPALYSPIEIACGLLSDEAAGFAAFLETPTAKAIMAANGL
ncbi:molybdate transport system substrate-binding protein [Rhodobacter aestuarii]|uniref:Molybdate transport system substrate-binding protein n=1 Tax=Rhodobacter aestuarii TaxID=453582 RepID=A0A1N7IYC4_9RHOB|nr:molybdate ABC transporter substrate-binding protein [Rhodobacter aestuarii]PTV97389.1 molybdate transport system substrate-binding protein [Rhodobacter aestuarii]SIS42112.1 molybdate transport system substrate-binding protein [Rhodobacter aestuarii]